MREEARVNPDTHRASEAVQLQLASARSPMSTRHRHRLAPTVTSCSTPLQRIDDANEMHKIPNLPV
jgi:hypothetical protein